MGLEACRAAPNLHGSSRAAADWDGGRLWGMQHFAGAAKL